MNRRYSKRMSSCTERLFIRSDSPTSDNDDNHEINTAIYEFVVNNKHLRGGRTFDEFDRTVVRQKLYSLAVTRQREEPELFVSGRDVSEACQARFKEKIEYML